MIQVSRFIKPEEEHILVQVPKELRGKFVEIVFQEKVTGHSAADREKLALNEIELQMMDKVRNQLNVWDI
ncbi:MAG: hypothetical protein ACKVPJ_13735 [Chitinophagales bacterium]